MHRYKPFILCLWCVATKNDLELIDFIILPVEQPWLPTLKPVQIGYLVGPSGPTSTTILDSNGPRKLASNWTMLRIRVLTGLFSQTSEYQSSIRQNYGNENKKREFVPGFHGTSSNFEFDVSHAKWKSRHSVGSLSSYPLRAQRKPR